MSITTVTGPKVDDLFGHEPNPRALAEDQTETTPRALPETPAPGSRALAESEPRDPYDTVVRRATENARKHFAEDYADVEMTVLHDASVDSGVPYRHLRFRSASSGFFYFDIITWPGSLTVTGGLDAFTFERLHDMMDFFGGRDINPSYWAEKCVSGKVRNTFDVEAYREEVETAIEDLDDYSDADQDAIRAAVADFLSDEPDNAEQAHRWAAEFRIGLPSGRKFSFYDTWEWDFESYTHHYLMACFAARHGVNAFRAAYPDRVIKEIA